MRSRRLLLAAVEVAAAAAVLVGAWYAAGWAGVLVAAGALVLAATVSVERAADTRQLLTEHLPTPPRPVRSRATRPPTPPER